MAKGPQERGLFELYEDDPERADALVFGRRTSAGRRGFLGGAGLAAVGAAVGSALPFSRHLPAGVVPVAVAQQRQSDGTPPLQGKEGLRVLNDRPVNAETPVHLLDPDVTPNRLHFVRNNGTVPEQAQRAEAGGWRIRVDGEVEQPLDLTLDELRGRFPVVRERLQLECGGNGRAAFEPSPRGNQWTLGAVGNAEWTGVRLRDVLQAAGLREGAVYTGHYGADESLGAGGGEAISRGVPIWKAMDPHTLIAFEMNGEPIPALNGFPVRLVVPGWPGSCSQKWLTRIWVRDRVHDGEKMGGVSYRVPRYPVEPGQEVPEEDFVIIQSMPVKSIITWPRTGTELPRDNRSIEVRGHAWAGDRQVSRVDVTTDFGATWQRAALEPPPNPYSWQRWRARLTFPTKGYYEVWARATDDEGAMQPFAVAWNPRGYLNNSMHRIALKVPT